MSPICNSDHAQQRVALYVARRCEHPPWQCLLPCFVASDLPVATGYGCSVHKCTHVMHHANCLFDQERGCFCSGKNR
jgi:hypothetical protein